MVVFAPLQKEKMGSSQGRGNERVPSPSEVASKFEPKFLCWTKFHFEGKQWSPVLFRLAERKNSTGTASSTASMFIFKNYNIRPWEQWNCIQSSCASPEGVLASDHLIRRTQGQQQNSILKPQISVAKPTDLEGLESKEGSCFTPLIHWKTCHCSNKQEYF